MRPSLAALSLVVLLVTAGCLGSLQPPPSDPGAEAVVEEAMTASESIETYRVRYDLTSAGTIDGDRRTVHVIADGAVDRPARKVRFNATQDDASRTHYVIGNTTYTECPSPWSGWGIAVEEALDEDWTGHDPLGRQLALLADGPVTWVGNETIRGTAVHVVEGQPSDRMLTQFSEERQPVIDLFGPDIRNATLTAWIAADSARVLKTRLAYEVRSNEGTVETRMTATFTDYGATVEIRLPAEALEGPYEHGCPGT